MRNARGFSIGLVAGLWALGCSQSGSIGQASPQPVMEAEVKVGMTSESQAEATPTANVPSPFSALWVTVTEVDVHVLRDDNDEQDHTRPDNDWIAVFSGEQLLNLFDVRSTEVFLGKVMVPAGRIDKIRLMLSDDVRVEIAGGVTIAAQCPSCAHSGLRFVVDDDTDFAASAGGHLHLVLNFDPQLSLTITDGGAILAPHLRIGAIED